MSAPPEDLGFTGIIMHGAEQLGVSLDRQALARMQTHVSLLQEWNAHVSLTACQTAGEIAIRHFLDSMTVFQLVRQGVPETVLDIGTGGGFPGLVLTVADRAKTVTLLDRDARKIVFLKQVTAAQGIRDVTFLNGPYQHFTGPRVISSFDVVVSRALSSHARFLAGFGRFLRPGGSMVRMAGPGLSEQETAVPGFVLDRWWEGMLPFSGHYRKLLVYRIDACPGPVP
jgi:16S rRNA (guanine527-N7)-methyltransferase